MMLRITQLFLFTVFTFWLSFQQKAVAQTTNTKIEQLKAQMQQATYDDSSKLFELGKTCIQLAKKANKEAEIGYVYQYYGTYFYFSNNSELANKYYNQSIEIAKKTKDDELLISTQTRKNYVLMDKDINAAEKEFQTLLSKAIQLKQFKNQVVIYNGLGILSENIMKDKDALKYYLSGIKIAEKHGFQYETGFLLNNIGLFKINHKNYAGAKTDLKRALEISQKVVEARRLRLNIFNNLGLVYKQTNNNNESIKHYKQTVVESKNIGFPNGIAVAMINLASSYYENSEFVIAKKYCDTIIQLSLSNHLNYAPNARLLQSLCLIELGEIQLASEGIQFVKENEHNLNVSSKIQLIEAQVLLAEAQKDYQLALKLEKKKNNFRDSIQQINNSSEISRMQAVFDNERIANEVKILHQKNNILATNNQLKDARLRSFILYFIIGLICVVAGIYVVNIRKAKRTKEQFSQNLITKIDAERSRISKDLHDDIGQSLAIVKSKINLFQAKKTTSLDGIENEIGDILEKTRSLSHRLHSSILEKIGLERALTELLDKTQDATKLICTLEYELDGQELPFEIASHLYPISQECISNSLKHASATALKISIFKEGNQIFYRYQDNGVGFDTSKKKEGIGLMTIQERASIIGGKIELKTGAQKGISLLITFGNENLNRR